MNIIVKLKAIENVNTNFDTLEIILFIIFVLINNNFKNIINKY